MRLDEAQQEENVRLLLDASYNMNVKLRELCETLDISFELFVGGLSPDSDVAKMRSIAGPYGAALFKAYQIRKEHESERTKNTIG